MDTRLLWGCDILWPLHCIMIKVRQLVSVWFTEFFTSWCPAIQGSLAPYEKRLVEFTFSPRVHPSEEGWSHHQGLPTQRDYTLFVNFITVGAQSTLMCSSGQGIRLYYAMECPCMPSLHRESTDPLICTQTFVLFRPTNPQLPVRIRLLPYL